MEGLTIEKLQVIIDANTKGIRQELSKLQSEIKQTTTTTEKQTSKITSFFKKMGKMVAVALSVAAITSFSKSCIELGSDLQEVQNVVDVTFGTMSEDVNTFAKNAISQFGLSELSAKQYTSTMGAMLKSMGFASDEVLVMSKNLTGLAGDMASFYNLSGDEAFQKIRAGISGETEPLKQLGINMSVANLEAYALSQGINKAYSSMGQAEQAMLRYNYLLSVTSDAQGDFARTSGSWANQTKILSESFNSVKASIGQGLINVLTPVLKLLNEIIPRLQTVANMFRDFTASIFGDAGGADETVSNTADAAGILSSNMQSTADAANSAKRALSGIDKLNNISSGKSDAASSGTSSGMSIDMSGITNVSSLIEKETSKISGIFDIITESMKESFSGAFSKIYEDGRKNFEQIKKVASKTWSTISELKSPLKKWFNTDFSDYFNTIVRVASNSLSDVMTLWTTVFSDIWTVAVLPMFENFVVVGLPMITQFATETTNSIGILYDGILSMTTLLWSEGIVPLLELFTSVWTDTVTILADTWDTYGKPIFDGINSSIQSVVDTFEESWKKWIKPLWDEIVQLLGQIWDEHLAPVVRKLGEFVGEFVLAAQSIYNNFILPIVNFLSNTLGPVFRTVFGSIYEYVANNVISKLIDAIGGIIDALTGIYQFIGGIFSGNWKKAWEGIKKIFSGVWTAMVNVIKIPINMIIGIINVMISAVESAMNFVIGGLNKLSFDVPDWVPGIGGETFGFNLSKVSLSRIEYLAKGGIVNKATPAIIGEAGKEAVLPLENNTGWMNILVNKISEYNNNSRLYDAICYLANKIGDGNIYVKVDMDGDVVYEKIEARRQQQIKMTAGYA